MGQIPRSIERICS